MARRIGWWILIGLAVACSWAVVAALLGPNHNPGHWTIAAITAPASLLGRRAPLGMGWFILLNGGLYAMAGLAIEPLLKLHQSRRSV